MAIVFWNSCKKGASSVGRICKHIGSQAGDFVGLLQEVLAWGKISGYTYSAHTVVSSEGSDCGFIIPRRWMPAVKSTSFGAYWCGAVVGSNILISAHVLDHLEKMAEQMLSSERLVIMHNKYEGASPI